MKNPVSRHEGLIPLIYFLACCGVPVAVAAFGSYVLAILKQPAFRISVVIVLSAAIGVLLSVSEKGKKSSVGSGGEKE